MNLMDIKGLYFQNVGIKCHLTIYLLIYYIRAIILYPAAKTMHRENKAH